MELAKIRNKARQDESGAGVPPTSPAVPLPLTEAPFLPAALPLSALPGDAVGGPDFEPVTPVLPPVSAISFDPLAAILAGRQADQQSMPSALADLPPQEELRVEERYQEFLCVILGSEEYGVNIMDIKELIKPRELTEVPHAPYFVEGVISLRGVIVPVLDLRKRLGLTAATPTGQERVVIVRRGESFSGLRVDAVTGVVRIPESRREATPAALEGIDRECVAGIGRSDDRMVILLDVEHLVDPGTVGEA